MARFYLSLKSDNEDDRKSTIIVLLCSAGGAFLAALADISPGLLFAAAGIFLACAILAWRYYIEPSRWIALTISFLTLAYLSFHNLGIRDTAMLALAAFLIGAGFLEGKRGVIIFGGLSALLIASIGFAESRGIITNKFSPFNSYTDYIATEISVILLGIFLWFVIDRLNQNFERAKQELNDRLQVEQKLRESEARYRELVENLPVGIYAAEPGRDGRWLYVSPKIFELTGYQANLWTEDRYFWFNHVHVDDREKATQAEAHALSESQMPILEYRFYHRNGKIVWIQDQSLKVVNPESGNIYLQGFLLDITARKEAEEYLKASEEKYHTLFKRAARQARELTLLTQVQSALANELDLQTILQTIVESAAYIYGYPLVSIYFLNGENLYLQHQIGYTHSIKKFSVLEGISGRVVRTGKPILIQDAASDPDFLKALPDIVSQICVPLFNGKEVCGVLNIESTEKNPLTEDDLKMMITLSEQVNIAIRRAQLYDERAENLQREQHLNEFSRAITSSLELPLILEKVAQLGTEILGAETGSIALMSDDGIEMTNVYSYNENPEIDSSPLPKGQGLTWLTYETGESILIDEYSHHPNALAKWAKDGLHAYITAPITFAGQRLGALAMYNRSPEKKFTQRDVILLEAMARQAGIAIQNARLFEALQNELEEHKRTQIQREKLIQELETKNAELERFTYTVSHDLKAPLVTIRGFVGLLEEDAVKGHLERFHKDVQRINEAALKMQRLLNELLELSRIGRVSNPTEEISFETIVSEALSLLEGSLNARQITVETGSVWPMVHGDRVRLIEVVQNLVDNAAKFMGNQSNPKIEIGSVPQNNENLFFVRDNGIGLESAFYEKVFGLFNKLDPDTEGTGVGLALVKRIVELHQGKIWVESEGVGKGSTFWFTLPTIHKKG